jgi:hypothetical protein
MDTGVYSATILETGAMIKSLEVRCTLSRYVVGGTTRMSLTQGEALSAFAIKCKLDRSPAALAAMAPIKYPLTMGLTASAALAWSRVLTAVRAPIGELTM